MTDEPRSTRSGGPRYPYLLALFATVLYVALVVCAFGFITLLAGTDVVERPDAGVLVGPSALAAAVVTVVLWLTRTAARLHTERVAGRPIHVPLGGAILAGIVTWLVYALVGAGLYALQTDAPVSFLLYLAESLARSYGIAVGILAVLVDLAFVLVLAGMGEHPARPLWPWERRE